jgi:hypothetical protein
MVSADASARRPIQHVKRINLQDGLQVLAQQPVCQCVRAIGTGAALATFYWAAAPLVSKKQLKTDQIGMKIWFSNRKKRLEPQKQAHSDHF